DLEACGATALNIALSFVGGLAAKIAGKYLWKWGKAANLIGRLKDIGEDLYGAIKDLPGLSRALSATCNSFTAGTRVVMADGTTKPIEKIKPGDQVLATPDQRPG